MKNYRRSNPLLAEIIIILLFFSLCACVLVGVFGSAHTTSQGALGQEQALLCAQDIAERFKLSSLDAAQFLTREGFDPKAVLPDRSFEALEGAWIKYVDFSGMAYILSAQPIEGEAHLVGFSLSLTDARKGNGRGERLFTLPVIKLMEGAEHE